MTTRQSLNELVCISYVMISDNFSGALRCPTDVDDGDNDVAFVS